MIDRYADCWLVDLYGECCSLLIQPYKRWTSQRDCKRYLFLCFHCFICLFSRLDLLGLCCCDGVEDECFDISTGHVGSAVVNDRNNRCTERESGDLMWCNVHTYVRERTMLKIVCW